MRLSALHAPRAGVGLPGPDGALASFAGPFGLYLHVPFCRSICRTAPTTGAPAGRARGSVLRGAARGAPSLRRLAAALRLAVRRRRDAVPLPRGAGRRRSGAPRRPRTRDRGAPDARDARGARAAAPAHAPGAPSAGPAAPARGRPTPIGLPHARPHAAVATGASGRSADQRARTAPGRARNLIERSAREPASSRRRSRRGRGRSCRA